MKKNLWILVGVMMSTSLFADQAPTASELAAVTNAPAASTNDMAPAVTTAPEMAPIAAPATDEAKPAKVAHHAKKKKSGKAVAKNSTTPEKTVELIAGPATVTGKNVNVRAQAKTTSEVVAHLHTDDSVVVLEEINLKNAKAGEPHQWAKIAFPTNANVWIASSLIDSNNAVKPKKANLRAGAGENFSVLGTVEAGTVLKTIQVKDTWTQIEPPANAYAFVAAEFLHQEPAPTEIAAVPAESMPTNTPVAETPVTAPVTAVTETVTAPAPVEPVIVPRVVSHEGVVKSSGSIQAPTHYQLMSPETGKIINYLFSTNSELKLEQYNERHIVVTGEEGMDERWKYTPVLTVQSIQVVE